MGHVGVSTSACYTSVVFVESGKINFSYNYLSRGSFKICLQMADGVTEAIELAHFASSPGRLFAR